MNFIYLLPFSYFYLTRLSKGSLAFHVLFEWICAALLVIVFSDLLPLNALINSLVIYIAFISLYEIGYMANDLFAANKETDGRLRGPQNVKSYWIFLWIATRLVVFLAITLILNQEATLAWWSYFLALTIVFFLHNYFIDREYKASTFIWLAWFRFMAPIIFIVESKYRMGIAFGAGIVYAAFRLFGYLDSKGLLCMPGRQRVKFRLVFFLIPLAGCMALFPYEEAYGFIVLCSYYALIVLLFTAHNWLSKRRLN